MAHPDAALESAFHATDALLTRTRIRHLYIGGLALMVLGEPRMTQDVDLIVFISRKTPGRLLAGAARAGFTVSRESALAQARALGVCRIAWKGVAVDVIFASTDFERSAWTRRKRARLFGRMVSLPSPEDMILLKIIPGRRQDLADIDRVAAVAGSRLDRAYIRKWAQVLCDRAQELRMYRQLEELKIL